MVLYTMKTKLFILFFVLFILVACGYDISYKLNPDDIDSTYIGKYKTEYVIYYGPGYAQSNIIYSDKEIYTCSFQGTNFLLEKDNTEEILSTTAPIRIVKSEIVK